MTPSDPGDADTGANNRQNFPVLQSFALAGANVNIAYSVPSPGTLTVEFFIADASGQGKAFLGQATYAGGGAATVATVPAGSVTAASRIVATATDAGGNTSEFSAPIDLSGAASVPVVADAASILLLLSLLGVTAMWLLRRRA